MTKKRPIDPMRLSEKEFSARVDAHLKKFDTLSPSKQLAYMIKAGWINADRTVPVYPMDHVPLGPRE